MRDSANRPPLQPSASMVPELTAQAAWLSGRVVTEALNSESRPKGRLSSATRGESLSGFPQRRSLDISPSEFGEPDLLVGVGLLHPSNLSDSESLKRILCISARPTIPMSDPLICAESNESRAMSLGNERQWGIGIVVGAEELGRNPFVLHLLPPTRGTLTDKVSHSGRRNASDRRLSERTP